MTKNEIYREILRMVLPYIRCIATWNIYNKLRDRSVIYETRLIQRIPALLSHEEFDDTDIYFLNTDCRYYYEHCHSRISVNYNAHVKSFAELFTIVPDHLRKQLTWQGPE